MITHSDKQTSDVRRYKLPFHIIHMDDHIHDYYEILYVYQGNCTYFFQGTSFPLRKGQFLILSPNTVHHIEMDKDGFGLTINIRKSTFQDTFQTLLNEQNLLSDFFAHTFYDAETSNYITSTSKTLRNLII